MSAIFFACNAGTNLYTNTQRLSWLAKKASKQVIFDLMLCAIGICFTRIETGQIKLQFDLSGFNSRETLYFLARHSPYVEKMTTHSTKKGTMVLFRVVQWCFPVHSRISVSLKKPILTKRLVRKQALSKFLELPVKIRQHFGHVCTHTHIHTHTNIHLSCNPVTFFLLIFFLHLLLGACARFCSSSSERERESDRVTEREKTRARAQRAACAG
jgi:hypothetical protein